MPESRHRLNNKVSALGCILYAHFRILYPILLRPGVEEFEAVDRVRVTSSGKIGFHVLSGHGGGLVGWMGLTGLGVSGKKQALKKSAFSLGVLPSSHATFLRGGEGVRSLSMIDTSHVLDILGIYYLVQLFMCPHFCFACVMVWWRVLVALCLSFLSCASLAPVWAVMQVSSHKGALFSLGG